MAPKVDHKLLEREFVTGDVSVRELARRHGISWSAVAYQARKEDDAGLTWYDKKKAFSESVSHKSYDKMAERVATEDVAIRDELVLVHRATIHAYAQQLREGKVAITPKDAVAASQQLLLMMGEATSRAETKNLDLRATVDLDEFRRIAELARSRLSSGNMAGLAPGEPEGTRPN